MRLGIDFGTTRIVVAAADRGNYPVVSFETPELSSQEWFPPLVAVNGHERLYGWEAWSVQAEPGWTAVRSTKRVLEAAGPQTELEIAGQSAKVLDLFTGMARELHKSLAERSSLSPAPDEAWEVMLGVPANANSNQRFLTVEAFRRAGFSVLGLLNEPSAASIEFGHRRKTTRESAGKTTMLVYDLGGGTFDVSLVEIEENQHEVVASEGIPTLGGDDFDEVLGELALQSAGLSEEECNGLTQAEVFRLHEECRIKKEGLNPNTRNITIDLSVVRNDWEEVSIPAKAFYDQCRSLVTETLNATEDLLAAHGFAPGGAAGGEGHRLELLYITGGGSELPPVARMLREVFGRRVQRSAYTRSATAIGLAIQADAQAEYRLREKFTRYFGVWREAEGGQRIVFDPLFHRGTPLPAAHEPPLRTARRYAPVHNIGHFRYLECSQLSGEDRPAGDITIWDDVRFPFDPWLRGHEDLAGIEVRYREAEVLHEVEESYECDASGIVTVRIADTEDGYARQYQLGRWAQSKERVTVGRRKKRGKRS
jgi:molecular chaperone DnaK (HSP70)